MMMDTPSTASSLGGNGSEECSSNLLDGDFPIRRFFDMHTSSTTKQMLGHQELEPSTGLQDDKGQSSATGWNSFRLLWAGGEMNDEFPGDQAHNNHSLLSEPHERYGIHGIATDDPVGPSMQLSEDHKDDVGKSSTKKGNSHLSYLQADLNHQYEKLRMQHDNPSTQLFQSNLAGHNDDGLFESTPSVVSALRNIITPHELGSIQNGFTFANVKVSVTIFPSVTDI